MTIVYTPFYITISLYHFDTSLLKHHFNCSFKMTSLCTLFYITISLHHLYCSLLNTISTRHLTWSYFVDHCTWPFHYTILTHHYWTQFQVFISNDPLLHTIYHHHFIIPFRLNLIDHLFNYVIIPLVLTITRHYYIVSTIVIYNDEIQLKDRIIVYTFVIIMYYDMYYDMFVSSYADVSLGDSRTHSLFSEGVIIAPFTIQVMDIIL